MVSISSMAADSRADLVHVNGYVHAAFECAAPKIVVAHSDVLSWWHAVHGQPAPPEWDAYARGTIVGLTRGTGRAHLARAGGGGHQGRPAHPGRRTGMIR